MILGANPPYNPNSKGYRWLPDCMNLSRPVRTKALYPIFADRRTRTVSALKQLSNIGLYNFRDATCKAKIILARKLSYDAPPPIPGQSTHYQQSGKLSDNLQHDISTNQLGSL